MNQRLQIDLSEERMKHIEALMKTCGIDTKRELVIAAISFFAWGVGEAVKGKTIASLSEDREKYSELEMPALSYARDCARTEPRYGT